MDTYVAVNFRSVYGKDLVYPANATANTFAAMLNKKTFDARDMRYMRTLGFRTYEVDRFGSVIGEIVEQRKVA